VDGDAALSPAASGENGGSPLTPGNLLRGQKRAAQGVRVEPGVIGRIRDQTVCFCAGEGLFQGDIGEIPLVRAGQLLDCPGLQPQDKGDDAGQHGPKAAVDRNAGDTPGPAPALVQRDAGGQLFLQRSQCLAPPEQGDKSHQQTRDGGCKQQQSVLRLQ